MHWKDGGQQWYFAVFDFSYGKVNLDKVRVRSVRSDLMGWLFLISWGNISHCLYL